MNAQVSWLLQGYFVLGGQDGHGFTDEVRKELCGVLRLRQPGFRIHGLPAHGRRHIVWWREGTANFSEAQFVAQIPPDCSCLRLGLSVEKGLDDASAAPDDLMDRDSWDWTRFASQAGKIISIEVPAASSKLERPLDLRVNVRRQREEARVFSFFAGQWFERHKGPIQSVDVVDYISVVDHRTTSWVDVYLTCDLGPSEAANLTAVGMAQTLLAFNDVRRRLRVQKTASMASRRGRQKVHPGATKQVSAH